MEKRSHRIGKFNILSNQGNKENIRVSLSGRNNADSGLFTKKIRAISGLSGDARYTKSIYALLSRSIV